MPIVVGILIGSLGGILSAGMGAVVAIRKVRGEIAKTRADASVSDATASSTVVDAAIRLIEPYVEQLHRQEIGLVTLRARVDVLEAHLVTLEESIRQAGGTPPPRPVLPSAFIVDL